MCGSLGRRSVHDSVPICTPVVKSMSDANRPGWSTGPPGSPEGSYSVKRFSEAMRDLDRAVEIADEALAAAHYNRSLLFHRLGDLPSARVEAEKASQLSPESMAYRQFFESLSGIEGLNDEAL